MPQNHPLARISSFRTTPETNSASPKYTQGQITSGHPDLAVTVNPSPLVATSGTTILINWTTQNIGTATPLVGWQERVYLSDDNRLDGSDRLLGSLARANNLAPGSSIAGTVNINLPIEISGTKYIIIQPDFPNSNLRVTSYELQVTLAPYADLVVSNITAPELLVRDPAQLDVSWKVSNQGTGAGITSSWIDRVILIGEGREITVGEFAHTGSLAVGSDYTRTESISLPAALTGKYQVFVRTDATNLVFENSSEANNSVAAAKLLTVMPIPYADLTVTNLVASSIAYSGQILTASWQVNNQGIGVTNNASVYEEVTLTSDPQGKIVIATLGKFKQVGGLGVGDNYLRNQDFRLADGLSGTFYLVVTVSNAFELDKTDNNTLVSAPIQVNLSPSPDLVISQITAPPSLQAGDKIDVTWQVTNNSIVDATGEWTDRVYLQLANITDAPLIGLGSFVYTNSLQAGKFYSRTELFTIPSNLQGQYQIVVKANDLGG